MRGNPAGLPVKRSSLLSSCLLDDLRRIQIEGAIALGLRSSDMGLNVLRLEGHSDGWTASPVVMSRTVEARECQRW